MRGTLFQAKAGLSRVKGQDSLQLLRRADKGARLLRD
jgi:hypothetical protein